MTMPRTVHRESRAGDYGFLLVLLFLALEYIRPQALFPPLRALHLPFIVTVLAILLWFTQGDKRVLLSRPVQLFALFLALTAGSVLFAANQYWVYQDTRILISYLLTVVLPMAAFIVEPERFKRFFKVWLGIQLVVALVAVLHGGTGAGGFLKDENDLAVVVTMAAPYAYFFAQSKERSLFGKLFGYGTLLVLIWAVVDSDSRGGFVALLAAAAASAWYSRRRFKLLLLVAFIGVVGYLAVGRAYIKEMETITNTRESTAYDRLYSWRLGWNMFLDNPVLGVGSGNYPWRVKDYELKSSEYHSGDRLHGGRMAHSLYFTLLPEYGIVGVLVFGSLVLVLFRDLKRLRRDLPKNPELVDGDLDMAARAVSASLVTYFAGATFLSLLYYPEFWLSIGTVLALDRAVRSQLPESAPKRAVARRAARTATPTAEPPFANIPR